jgi:hypothetical protein
VRAERRILVPAVLTPPAAPDPDDRDRDGASDYVTEQELRDRGIDPALVRVICPWATELHALDGSRCWSRADLRALLEGN